MVHGTVPVQTDVAVGVDHARDEPPPQRLDVVPGAGGPLEGEAAPDHPGLRPHLLGPDENLS